MGLDVFCATSDNEKYPIKQFYRKQQELLTKLTKKLSGSKHKRKKEDKVKPSQRFLKVKSKLSKLYEKIANQRTDNAYKLVNYFLVIFLYLIHFLFCPSRFLSNNNNS